MLRGCQKKIIMVRDTNSRYFESAYFVIKSELPPSACENDMLAEAHRIIADCSAEMAFQNVGTGNNVPPQKHRTVSQRFILGVLFAFTALGIFAAVLAIL